MAEIESQWYVVFEGTGERPGNDLGLVTFTSFRDGEDFERFITETGYKDIVLAKGVDLDAARDYRRSSAGARFNNLLHESMNSEGRIVPDLARAMANNEKIRRMVSDQAGGEESFRQMMAAIVRCFPGTCDSTNCLSV